MGTRFLSRRRFLERVGPAVALGVLVACGKQPETIIVTPPAAPAPTNTPPTAAPAAPTAAAVPASQPAAAAPPPAVPTAASAPTSAPRPAAPTVAPTATPAAPAVARPQYGQDAQHTGRSAHAGPRSVKPTRWFDTTNPGFETPDPGFDKSDIQSSAAVGADGTIYIGNFSGNVLALRDPGRGDKLELAWRFHPKGGSPWHHTPAIARDGTIYSVFSVGGNAPDAKGTLYALRAPASGMDAQVVWSLDMGPGRTTSSPTLGPDGTIYVVNQGGRLMAVSPDGQPRWSMQVGPAIKASPTLGYDGSVYVPSMDGKLYSVVLRANEPSVAWTFDFAQHLGPTPLMVDKAPPAGGDAKGSGASAAVGPDGTVYVGANNSNFYAVGGDGKLKWLYEAEREIAGIWSAPALAADAKTLYFAANKGGVYAVGADDGKLKWRSFVFGSIFNSPTLDSQGVLYTGSNVGHVVGIEATTGKQILDYDAGAPVWTAPAIRPDGSLVVADRKGRVLLLGPA